ncbi:MAG: class I SAM-dependent methyltransferase [Bacillus subtilis]|nr:class I SAM-dependent methyltransferase [Bacillus subtilis]
MLTPTKPTPKSWLEPIAGKTVLCLASGGGQQGPLFAAMGANVTVFDNSPEQLAQDQFVAKREGLSIQTIQGDMRDLSCFNDETFDLVFHPVSNAFVDDVLKVWKEAYRVLKMGGVLVAGFCNPILYIFDLNRWDKTKELVVRYKILLRGSRFASRSTNFRKESTVAKSSSGGIRSPIKSADRRPPDS